MNTTKNSGEQNSLNNRHGGKSANLNTYRLILRYMKEEREIRKKHRKWEDMFLFGIFAFLAVILCLLFGISGAPGEGTYLKNIFLYREKRGISGWQRRWL